MSSAAKWNVVIPEDHRLSLEVPADLPAGPAEVIVLVTSRTPSKPSDATSTQSLADDPRWAHNGAHWVLVAHSDVIDDASFDHRALRDERSDALIRGAR